MQSRSSTPHDGAPSGPTDPQRTLDPAPGEAPRLTGIGASPGTVVGSAWVYQPAKEPSRTPHTTGAAGAVSAQEERDRLHAALASAAAELQELAQRVRQEVGEAESDIFVAQALMLEDPTISERAEALIGDAGQDAATALAQAAEEQAQLMEALPDPLFQARAADVRDAARRAVAKLDVDAGGEAPVTLSERIAAVEEPVILVAEDLGPSDTVQLPSGKLLAIATALGSTTSHAAILSRARGIPAVVGLGQRVFSDVRTGDTLILDGRSGEVVVNPSAAQVAEVKQKLAREAQQRAAQTERTGHTAGAVRLRGQTRDGHPVPLLANVGSQVEAQAAVEAGAEGIGLLRTEFVFAERTAMPSAEEQADIYRAIIEPFNGTSQPVIIRTLDAGADKPLPALKEQVDKLPREANPALGVRGIRLQLQYPELLRDQMAGILLAAASVTVHTQVMLPMVATLEELTQGAAALEDARTALVGRGSTLTARVPLGIMIETPAAVLTSDALAAHVAFFSIGSNDLTQYVMAADRLNPELARLAQPLQPAVLRAIAQVVGAASRAGIATGVCGEMAGEPSLGLLLVGLGVHELSMAPGSIPAVRDALGARALDELRQFARRVLQMRTAAEIEEAIAAFAGILTP